MKFNKTYINRYSVHTELEVNRLLLRRRLIILLIVMVFLVAGAFLTASVVYDIKNRREMAAELEDWEEVGSRRFRRREKLFLAQKGYRTFMFATERATQSKTSVSWMYHLLFCYYSYIYTCTVFCSETLQ